MPGLLSLFPRWSRKRGSEVRRNYPIIAIREADLQEAGLQEACLQEACLQEACLPAAGLQNADLDRIDGERRLFSHQGHTFGLGIDRHALVEAEIIP